MKIAVIGGGSSYTPELVDGLFPRLERIPVTEVWMMDPNLERLKITAGLAGRMSERHGKPFTVHHTDNLAEAVAGAKYVVTQLRVGGIQARIADEKLGLRHNIIGQETTGVGGFCCALRTIPRILDIAKAMEKSAPGGYLINFTNPSGIVTEALVKHSSITSFGLCNIPVGIIMEVVKQTGCKMEEVELEYVGLNHLSWVRGFKVGGTDRTKEVLDKFIETADKEWDDPAICESMRAAMRSTGMFMNGYLQYFYATEAALAKIKKKDKTRGEEVVAIEESLFEKYKQPELNEKPEELSKRGGAHYSTAAFYLIDAIENDTKNTQIVATRNNGAIPTFDDDASVEVPCIIGKDGATAIPQAAPAPIIRGLMQQVKSYETLTVKAAVTGDRETAYQALLANPLMPSAAGCLPLLDDLLEVNRPHLQGTFF